MHFACLEHHSEKSASKISSSESEEDREVRLDLKAGGLAGVWKTVKSLITNGPYMFLVLFVTFGTIVVSGFTTFGVKYFQQQFGLTASLAGVVFGQYF